MDKVSVLVPTYNEEKNVRPLIEAIIREFETNLPDYDYEIIFIDNDSKDSTRVILREMCKKDKRIKAIFNVKILGSLIHPIMDCFRQLVIVLFSYVLISRIRLK